MLAVRIKYDLTLTPKVIPDQHHKEQTTNNKAEEVKVIEMGKNIEMFSHDSFKDILRKLYLFNVTDFDGINLKNDFIGLENYSFKGHIEFSFILYNHNLESIYYRNGEFKKKIIIKTITNLIHSLIIL
jgi:hypothetical protein